MLISQLVSFFLDIAKEIATVLATSYILSLLKTKKEEPLCRPKQKRWFFF